MSEASHTFLSPSRNVLAIRSASFVVIASLDGSALVADVEVPTAELTGGVFSLAFRFKSLLSWFITERRK
jgi:hypothetical protein